MRTPLVLLDRDGVINRDSSDYIRGPADWQAIPGSLEAIARFNRAGWQVAVCTNQSGLRRGLLNAADLDAIHGRFRDELAAVGGWLDGLFVCPHTDDDACDCRKPRPGLLYDACSSLGHEPGGVPLIGDSARDLQAAQQAGGRPLLVRTGNGQRTLAEGACDAVGVYADLAQAAESLLAEDSTGNGVIHDA